MNRQENSSKNSTGNMHPAIRNIIFDFGGVIFNIDHEKLEKAYRNLGMDNFEILFNQASQTDLFQEFEKGRIEPDEFRDGLRKLTGLTGSDEQLDLTWNEILCDYPPHRIDLLKGIQKEYRIFLLSNTNIIHYKHYTSLFEQRFGYDLNELFEAAYWSFKIGKRKPNPDPYLHILDTHKLIPHETLFIDDSIQNIVAAENLNILALHLANGMDVSELFDDDLLRPEIVNNLTA